MIECGIKGNPAVDSVIFNVTIINDGGSSILSAYPGLQESVIILILHQSAHAGLLSQRGETDTKAHLGGLPWVGIYQGVHTKG